MPLFLIPLVSWLGSTLLAAIAFFVSRKGFLFTILVGVLAVVGTAVSALMLTIDSLIGSVLPTSVGFIAPFAPDNLPLCLGAIVSTHIACTGFRLTIKFIRWKTDVMTS